MAIIYLGITTAHWLVLMFSSSMVEIYFNFFMNIYDISIYLKFRS